MNGTEYKKFAIIGNPVGHSLSPAMHNAALAALDIPGEYLAIQTEDLAATLRELHDKKFCGASVTIPFKTAIIDLLDQVEPMARQIGAVNTLCFQKDEEGKVRCIGDNTDWLGAVRALEEQTELAGKQALVLGAGGAGRAVAFGLARAGAQVLLSNRGEEKGRLLAAQLNCPFVPAAKLDQVRAEILVNTTSVGMAPLEEDLPIAARLLPRFSFVMDIVYAPLNTLLLREAAACGCATIDGLRMLLHQGAAQFTLWTGQAAPLELMSAALQAALRQREAERALMPRI